MTLSRMRVHIAPVGFEVDRIVESAKELKADKIWLLVHSNPNEDEALSYQATAKKSLKKLKVQSVVEHVNRLDLFEILKTVKEIVKKEQDNDIYINVASGSKIHAIALMMAAMMFNDKKNIFAFYAVPKKYSAFKEEQLSYGLKDVMSLPTFEIQRPKSNLISALKIVQEHDGRIAKKDLAVIAEEKNLIQVNAEKRNLSNARFASLDQNIIQPLERLGYVEVEKIGRSRWVNITEEGTNATRFL